MSKLIATYRSEPNAANRTRLQNYLNKHSMAVCAASVDELTFLRANSFAL